MRQEPMKASINHLITFCSKSSKKTVRLVQVLSDGISAAETCSRHEISLQTLRIDLLRIADWK